MSSHLRLVVRYLPRTGISSTETIPHFKSPLPTSPTPTKSPITQLPTFPHVTSLVRQITTSSSVFEKKGSSKEGTRRSRLLQLVGGGLIVGAGFLHTSGQKVGGVGGNSSLSPDSIKLVDAVAAGDVEQVTALLRRGVSPDIVEDGGWTPLITAAQKGNEQIVKLLVDNGAPLNNVMNKSKQTALMSAVMKGHKDIVEKLIAAGADVNKSDTAGATTLMCAVMKGHKDIVEKLITAGADVNKSDTAGFTPLMAASQRGHSDIVKLLLDAKASLENVHTTTKQTALHQAATKGHTVIVQKLITAGADVNKSDSDGVTPLKCAVMEGHKDIVEKLIAAGADVNKSNTAGWTPLMSASQRGHSDIVNLLLDAKASLENVDTTTKQSALWIAAIDGHTGIVTTLVQAGAKVNTHDWTGTSPLHAASNEGHVDIVRSLLSHGADIEIKDKDGRRPLGSAAYRGHKEVLELLIQEGANVNQGGTTPLMYAAQFGHNHCVTALIQHGADVNQVDTWIHGRVALRYAVEQKLEDTAVLLLSDTNISGMAGKNVMYSIGRTGLGRVCEEFLRKLEREDTDSGTTNNDGSGRRIMNWIASKGRACRNYVLKLSVTDILQEGLEGAAEFGEAEVSKMILGKVKDEQVRLSMARSVMKLAVYSDRESVVKVILNNLDKVDGDIVDLVEKRKVCKVVDAFLENGHRHKLKDIDIKKLECLSTKSVLEKAKELIKIKKVTKIPKSEEFEYFSTPGALLKLLREDKVSIEEAVSVLKAKDVHIKEKCGQDCKQPQICQYFRESNNILLDIVKRLGDKAEIFRGTTVKMIGSILEGTRIGASDESDTLVSLDNNFKEYFRFDSESQQVRVDCKGNARMADIFAPYIDGTFNGSKYMDDFLEAVYEIIKLYEQDKSALPKSCKESREFLNLSVSYTPCPECVDTKYGSPIFTRCRHTYDQNNEPTVCFSKVGIVLHLGWKKPGATEWDHRMDVDLTCPRIPTTDQYGGQVTEIAAFLIKHKFVGWLDEYNKLTETAGAAASVHLADATTWLVQCRRINTEDVIPRQTLNFMSGETLEGPKLDVYILLKILKIITDSAAKSYEVKFSLNEVYFNSLPDEDKLGEAALTVMDFKMLKGKFNGLDPELKKAGYCGVDLDSLKSGYIKLIKQQDSQQTLSKKETTEEEGGGCYKYEQLGHTQKVIAK